MTFIFEAFASIFDAIKKLLTTVATGIAYAAIFILLVAILTPTSSAPVITAEDLPVIQLIGPINDLLPQELLQAQFMIKRAFANAKRSNTDMVILIIDTPGGSVGTTIAIENYLLACKAEYEKELVVMIPWYSASAGTWISTTADYIMVTPQATIGSIGVLLGAESVYIGEILEKIGIDAKIFFTPESAPHKLSDPTENGKTSKNKDIVRARLQQKVERFHEEFVLKVLSRKGLQDSATHRSLLNEFGGDVDFAYAKEELFKELGLLDEIVSISEMLEYLDNNIEGFKSMNSRGDIFKSNSLINIASVSKNRKCRYCSGQVLAIDGNYFRQQQLSSLSYYFERK